MRTGRVGGAAILSGTALLILAGCSPAMSDGARAGPPPSASNSAVPITPARLARSVLPPEAPVAATLPSGIVVPIRPAATTRDGRLDVPIDTGVAGWWQGSSRVGDPFGSTLVAAHVDSTSRGLGPFAELLSVGRGDRVVLATAHLTQEFAVDSLRLVPQGPLVDEEWLFSASGPHRLTLVTCAPPYDRTRGGYQNLAVITASPVDAPTWDRSP